MTKNKVLALCVAAVIVVLGLIYVFSHTKSQTAGGFPTCGDNTSCTTGNLYVSGQVTGGNLQVGSVGSVISGIQSGTCTIFAYSTTIAASSTAQVDCQAGASSLSAISGITSGDRIFASLASTTSAIFEGIDIQWVAASTTPGYITMKLYNGTGGTFTWSSTASSSIPYLVVR